MFKKILVAAVFCGGFAFAGLGTASSAQANCFGGGFGGPSGFGSYGVPRSRVSYSRGFDKGFGPSYYGSRGFRGKRGVNLSIGF